MALAHQAAFEYAEAPQQLGRRAMCHVEAQRPPRDTSLEAAPPSVEHPTPFGAAHAHRRVARLEQP